MFYHFHQNNSGGHFDYDYERGISCNVIIEADSVDDANRRARFIGLYFDGAGDCSCCGSRWSEQWNYSGSVERGDELPELYGESVALTVSYGWRDEIEWEGFLHFKDFTKVGFANANGLPGLEVLKDYPKSVSLTLGLSEGLFKEINPA